MSAEDDAAAEPELVPLTYQGESIDNDDPDTDIARFGLDAAPWMPRVIAMMNDARGHGFQPQQIALITGAHEQLYLIVEWGRPLQSWLEFHKVTELGGDRVRIEFLRRLREGNAAWMSAYTGAGLFPGEPPVVVVVENHGNHECDNELRLIQLDRNTIDITPDSEGEPIRNLVDLDGDGVVELVSSGGPAWFCQLRYGGIPVVLRRVADRFVFACTEFPEHYDQWLRAQLESVPDVVPARLAEVYRASRQALMLAQVGRAEEGLGLLRRSLASLPDHVAAAVADTRWLDRVSYQSGRRQFLLVDLFERALSQSAGCPFIEALNAARAASRADEDE